jgi:hypothetical protein
MTLLQPRKGFDVSRIRPSAFRKPIRITITIPWVVYEKLLNTSALQGRSLSNLAAHWLEKMPNVIGNQASSGHHK